MPCAEFARWLSNETGCSIVVEDSLDKRPVTIELIDQTIDDALSAVARRMSVQVTRTGSLYYLGTLRREDKGILVRRCRRLSQEDLRNALGTLTSEFGSVVTFADGLVVIGDRVEVLTKLHDLIEQIENTDSPVWVVQLHLIDLGSTDKKALGLDLTPSLDVSLAFASGSAAGIAKPTANLKGGLDAVLKAARTTDNSRIIAEPLFILGDGQEAKLVRGEKVPIPRKTVSNQGTVTTQGFDFVQTGFKTDLHLREVGRQSASLKVNTELSTITRFVDSAPVTAIESVETIAVLESGGVYLMASLERGDEVNKTANGLRWSVDRSFDARVLQVWARVYRVAAPAPDELAAEAPGGGGAQATTPPEESPQASFNLPISEDLQESAKLGDEARDAIKLD